MAEKIYSALLQIQSELKAPKNQYNKFGGYKYRSAEDILEAVKPLHKKFNCTQIVTSDIVGVNGSNYVKVKVKLVEDEDESNVEVTGFAKEADHKKGMDPAQITGATFSYALKYALNGLYAIDDTKDVDSEEYQQRGRQQSQQRRYSQPQQSRQKVSQTQRSSNAAELEKQYVTLRKQLVAKLKAPQKDVEEAVIDQASRTQGWAKMSKDDKYQKMIGIMKEMYKE